MAIVKKACAEPLRWIAENAGFQGYVVTSKVTELPLGEGLNALTGQYLDLVKDGVIDPVKVTRSALRNAASIASMILTTDTLVVEKKEEEPAPAAGPRPRPLGERPAYSSARHARRAAPPARGCGPSRMPVRRPALSAAGQAGMARRPACTASRSSSVSPPHTP